MKKKKKRKKTKKEKEEERRICKEEIKREKKNLYLLNAKRRLLFGMENENPTSRFINEINEDNLSLPPVDEFERRVRF